MGKHCVSGESASHCSVCAVLRIISYSKTGKEGDAGGSQGVNDLPAYAKMNVAVL